MRAILPTEVRSRAARRLAGDEGQAIVEAAIVLPAMIFLILVVLQLTMIQHARIMLNYAAYSAARAGVVFNGDPCAMKRAAVVALSPTMGRTDTLGAFESTMQGGAGINSVPAEMSQAKTFNLPGGAVEVETLVPPNSSFGGFSSHTGGAEMDFDDIRSGAAQVNILQIRVKNFYRMRIPYANKILQAIYMATVSAPNLLQNWKRTSFIDNPGQNWVGNAQGVYAGSQGGFSAGMPVVPDSAAIVTAAISGVYYFPLRETYSMRMQSNWFANTAPGVATPCLF